MTHDTFDVGLLLGSARRAGWTQRVAAAVGAVAPPSLALRAIELAHLPLYHEDLELTVPEPWARFRAEVKAADALLFITPEYNRSVPAALKNAIDIGSAPDEASVWWGKPGAIVSFSPGSLGGFGANHHLRQSLVFLNVPVLQQPEVYLSRVDQLFAPDGELLKGRGKDLLTELMQEFAAWIARICSSQEQRNVGKQGRSHV